MNKESIKSLIMKNIFTKWMYVIYRNSKEKKEYKKRFNYNGIFKNRSNKNEDLCLILAGYKDYLYDDIFDRIKRFSSSNLDICIITSGMYSEQIDKICSDNNWSYLSTKENNVCLVQNVAISLFPDARYIYKLDEDIFITNNYFSKLKKAYIECYDKQYRPGLIAPVIPLNGFGHYLVLDKLNLLEDYEQRFEHPLYMAGSDRMIESNPDVAKYFWRGNPIPLIDELNKLFEKNNEIVPCPVRFSIGAIMFERQLWQDMGFFDVNRNTNDLGMDEVQICYYCARYSRPIMVTKNTVVGHFSFGKQTSEMIAFYENNKDKFKIKL